MAVNKPYTYAFGYSQGRRDDALLGADAIAVPVVITGSRFGSTTEVIAGPSLWVREDDSVDRNAVPLNLGGEVNALASYAGVTNGKITFLTAADAYHFKVGDTVAAFGYTSGEFIATTATVTAVSGESGAICVDTNMANIAQYDKVVVTTNYIGGSTSADARAVVIMEDVSIASGETLGTKAYINGSFVKSLIKGATFTAYGQTTAKDIFTQSANQQIQLVDIQ